MRAYEKAIADDVKPERFIIEGQVVFVTEDSPNGKQLIRLHMTDARHDDDFDELADVSYFGMFCVMKANL